LGDGVAATGRRHVDEAVLLEVEEAELDDAVQPPRLDAFLVPAHL
jgi:hypothetical protein